MYSTHIQTLMAPQPEPDHIQKLTPNRRRITRIPRRTTIILRINRNIRQSQNLYMEQRALIHLLLQVPTAHFQKRRDIHIHRLHPPRPPRHGRRPHYARRRCHHHHHHHRQD